MSSALKLNGQRFGRLLVVARARANTASVKARWICKCDCGRTHITTSGSLKNKSVTSCGCFRKEVCAETGRRTSQLRAATITHCRKGHEFTPDNTHRGKRGTRVCRACRYDSVRKVALPQIGWTTELYDQIESQQSALCAICNQPESCKDGRRLAADHDHDTLQPRKLICSNCNKGLGCFQDNPELLAAALKYLQEFGK